MGRGATLICPPVAAWTENGAVVPCSVSREDVGNVAETTQDAHDNEPRKTTYPYGQRTPLRDEPRKLTNVGRERTPTGFKKVAQGKSAACGRHPG